MHSSTLCTASAYWLIRFSPSFGLLMKCYFLFVPGLNIFIAGLAANFEYNLRKVFGFILYDIYFFIFLMSVIPMCLSNIYKYKISVKTQQFII